MTKNMTDLVQIGGDHYTKLAVQPWQIIEENGLDFFEGSALKYIMRWKEKGGIQDLKKSIHYIQKIIELAELGHYKNDTK